MHRSTTALEGVEGKRLKYRTDHVQQQHTCHTARRACESHLLKGSQIALDIAVLDLTHEALQRLLKSRLGKQCPESCH